MESYLLIYLRDELSSWYSSSSKKISLHEGKLQDHILQNLEIITGRMNALSCKTERLKVSLILFAHFSRPVVINLNLYTKPSLT